jgi:hypothetical protein
VLISSVFCHDGSVSVVDTTYLRDVLSFVANGSSSPACGQWAAKIS